MGNDGSLMGKTMHGKLMVATPAIGHDRCSRRHRITDEWHPARPRGIRNPTPAPAPKPLGRQHLDGDRDPRFSSCTPPTLALLRFTAHPGCIHFHLTAPAIASQANHRRPKAMQHRPSRRVGTKAQPVLEHLGRATLFRRRHGPGHREPDRHQRPRAVEDRPHGHRHPTPAAFAPEPSIAHPPTLVSSAARANKTAWPAEPFERVNTGVIIGKPCAKLSLVTRLIATGLESRDRLLLRHAYILYLPHSDGYPLSEKASMQKQSLGNWPHHAMLTFSFRSYSRRAIVRSSAR